MGLYFTSGLLSEGVLRSLTYSSSARLYSGGLKRIFTSEIWRASWLIFGRAYLGEGERDYNWNFDVRYSFVRICVRSFQFFL